MLPISHQVSIWTELACKQLGSESPALSAGLGASPGTHTSSSHSGQDAPTPCHGARAPDSKLQGQDRRSPAASLSQQAGRDCPWPSSQRGSWEQQLFIRSHAWSPRRVLQDTDRTSGTKLPSPGKPGVTCALHSLGQTGSAATRSLPHVYLAQACKASAAACSVSASPHEPAGD